MTVYKYAVENIVGIQYSYSVHTLMYVLTAISYGIQPVLHEACKVLTRRTNDDQLRGNFRGNQVFAGFFGATGPAQAAHADHLLARARHQGRMVRALTYPKGYVRRYVRRACTSLLWNICYAILPRAPREPQPPYHSSYSIKTTDL